MKNITSLLLILVSTLSYEQSVKLFNQPKNPKYSKNSEIVVVYGDDPNQIHENENPVGVFVNGKFIGNKNAMQGFNSQHVESLKVEKERFEKHGKKYAGKILIEMKPN